MRRRHLRLSRGYKSPPGLAEFDFRSASHRERFREFYGGRIIEFGAGQRQEVGWIARRINIDAVPFEPFPRQRGKLSIRLARQLADGLLGRLRRGWRPDTVFCNFVLSSMGSPRLVVMLDGL